MVTVRPVSLNEPVSSVSVAVTATAQQPDELAPDSAGPPERWRLEPPRAICDYRLSVVPVIPYEVAPAASSSTQSAT